MKTAALKIMEIEPSQNNDFTLLRNLVPTDIAIVTKI
jgi:hypothetical protein